MLLLFVILLSFFWYPLLRMWHTALVSPKRPWPYEKNDREWNDSNLQHLFSHSTMTPSSPPHHSRHCILLVARAHCPALRFFPWCLFICDEEFYFCPWLSLPIRSVLISAVFHDTLHFFRCSFMNRLPCSWFSAPIVVFSLFLTGLHQLR